MKTKMILLAVTMLASFAGFAHADTAKAVTKKAKCATECDLAKSKCPQDCKKASITHVNVTGMTCGGCSKKLNTALAAVKGVEVKKICHKSGSVDVVLSDGATAAQVTEVITKSGFKVAPEKEVKG
ncbi:MAG: copper chaperone CopZ [Crocinitomicaceae bacterium]|jgi:copper chaperone CopZ